MKKIHIDYKNAVTPPFFLAIFLLLNFSAPVKAPLAISFFSALIYYGFNPFITFAVYAVSLVYPLDATYFICCVGAGLFVLLFRLIFKKIRPPYFLRPVIVFVSLIPLILFGTNNSLFVNLAIISAIALTEVPFKIFLNFACFKKLNAKPDEKDLLSLVCVYFFVALGFAKVAGANVSEPVVLILVLFCSRVLKRNSAVLTATLLSLPVAVYRADFGFVATASVFACVLYFLYDFPKYVTAMSFFALDFGARVLKDADSAFNLTRLIIFTVLLIIYVLFPDKYLKSLKDKIYGFEDKVLVKQAINSVKICLADKLFDLSSSFTKIAGTLEEGNKEKRCDVKDLCSKLFNEVCIKESCRTRCPLTADRFSPLFETGLSRGKISLIDIPEDLSVACKQLPSVLYNANKLLSEYKDGIKREREKNLAGKLMSKESRAVGELLKGLASDVGRTSSLNYDTERKIQRELAENGITSDEIIVFGEGKNLNVHLLGEFDTPLARSNVLKIIDKATERKMQIDEITDVTKNKCALSIGPKPKFKITTGVSALPKNGSSVSGDTFTALSINSHRKLLAVSDGMGSGKSANEVSSGALTLFENFYKAGLSADKVVEAVNKILTVSLKDDFTALDVSFVDESDGSLTVMKYGAVYSLIFTSSGVKIIEGGSLPIGIVSELRPSSAVTAMKDGDMLVMMSDGVTDNFSDMAELIEFVNDNYTADPQELSVKILNRALTRDGGIPHDDMTVLCARADAS